MRRLLAVLALGTGFIVLVTFVAVAAVGIPHGASYRRDRTELDIRNLEKGMKLYRARTGQYPEAANGFAALLEAQILGKEPRDAWGNPYRYQLVEGRPVITSFGADGLPGGEGVDADISNRSPEIPAR